LQEKAGKGEYYDTGRQNEQDAGCGVDFLKSMQEKEALWIK